MLSKEILRVCNKMHPQKDTVCLHEAADPVRRVAVTKFRHFFVAATLCVLTYLILCELNKSKIILLRYLRSLRIRNSHIVEEEIER